MLVPFYISIPFSAGHGEIFQVPKRNFKQKFGIFFLEDGSNIFFRNVGSHTDYMKLYPR
jgi:hypothetical protein